MTPTPLMTIKAFMPAGTTAPAARFGYTSIPLLISLVQEIQATETPSDFLPHLWVTKNSVDNSFNLSYHAQMQSWEELPPELQVRQNKEVSRSVYDDALQSVLAGHTVSFSTPNQASSFRTHAWRKGHKVTITNKILARLETEQIKAEPAFQILTPEEAAKRAADLTEQNKLDFGEFL